MEAPTRRYFFADNGTSQNCFAAYAKVRSDIQAHELRWKLDNPDATLRHSDPAHVLYYNIPLGKTFPSRAWCVDIKAAYPTTLRNMGAVQDVTYRWCMDNLKKPERLKAVGMLAGSKYVQLFQDAVLAHQYRDNNPLRPWFFDVCDYVGQVMRDVSDRMGRGFMFFWVDGVFLDIDDPSEAVGMLQEYGYEATAERIEGIRWSASGKYILFRKNGKPTYLCVPRRIEIEDADLIASIQRLKNPQPNVQQFAEAQPEPRPVLGLAPDLCPVTLPDPWLSSFGSDPVPF